MNITSLDFISSVAENSKVSGSLMTILTNFSPLGIMKVRSFDSVKRPIERGSYVYYDADYDFDLANENGVASSHSSSSIAILFLTS